MSSSLLLAASPVLADSDIGKGSPVGFFVVLVLVIAVYFLYRSMSRHIRNLPPDFDRQGGPPTEDPDRPVN